MQWMLYCCEVFDYVNTVTYDQPLRIELFLLGEVYWNGVRKVGITLITSVKFFLGYVSI